MTTADGKMQNLLSLFGLKRQSSNRELSVQQSIMG